MIALNLGSSFPEGEIVATDVSEDALALARENAERLGLSGRVKFVNTHLLNEVDGTFDLIVANLPYISTQDRQSLPREVLHDPDVALFGGSRGDELVRELIEQAPAWLNPAGLLALEVGIGQAAELTELLREKKYHDIESKNDYSGVSRFLFGRYG